MIRNWYEERWLASLSSQRERKRAYEMEERITKWGGRLARVGSGLVLSSGARILFRFESPGEPDIKLCQALWQVLLASGLGNATLLISPLIRRRHAERPSIRGGRDRERERDRGKCGRRARHLF